MGKNKKATKPVEVVEEEEEPAEADPEFDMENAKKQLGRFLNPNYSTEFVQSLPTAIKNRVEALQGLQGTTNTLRKKEVEERKALEQKYEALYQPFYEKRLDIVTGKVEPSPTDIKRGAPEGYEAETNTKNTKKSGKVGVPDFWLTALKNNMNVAQLIEERDEPCLQHLTNITAKNFEDPDTGFTLEFHFSSNSYFTNNLLVKTYHLLEEEEVVLDRAEGCDIDWKPKQNLTVISKTKKQKAKGGKATRSITKEEPCESFFNFFKPPQLNEDADEEEDDDDDENPLEEMIEADYELGRIIKEDIIPRAVLWYTGELTESMDDSDEEEEEEEGEESDEEPVKKGKKEIGNAKNKLKDSAPGADGQQPPECKQQ